MPTAAEHESRGHSGGLWNKCGVRRNGEQSATISISHTGTARHNHDRLGLKSTRAFSSGTRCRRRCFGEVQSESLPLRCPRDNAPPSLLSSHIAFMVSWSLHHSLSFLHSYFCTFKFTTSSFPTSSPAASPSHYTHLLSKQDSGSQLFSTLHTGFQLHTSS